MKRKRTVGAVWATWATCLVVLGLTIGIGSIFGDVVEVVSPAGEIVAVSVEAESTRQSREDALCAAESALADANIAVVALEAHVAALSADVRELAASQDATNAALDETEAHLAAREATLATAVAEIMRLEAKLFDALALINELQPQMTRPFGFTFWQLPDVTRGEWASKAELAKIFAGISVTAQNRWPGSFEGAFFAERLSWWADDCREVGWNFQPYLTTRLTSVADVQALAAEDWPDNVHRLMANSEVKDADQPWDEFPLYRECIPSSVAVAMPEGVSIGSDGIVETQEFFQSWLRVSGNAATSRDHQRRITNIPAVMAVAKCLGEGETPINIGPQIYNTSWAVNETRENIRTAIFLAAQASLKSAEIPTNIVAWGAKYITSDEPLKAVADAIREINAIEITADAVGERPAVAVLIDEATNVRNWYSLQVLWEMIVRANIPYEVILREDLCADVLARYQAVVVPVLNDETTASFSAAEYGALQDFALTGHPVIAECGDVLEYGGHQGKPIIPPCATTLLSARYTREPFEWSPSFSDFGLLDETYEMRMQALIEDYREKVGAQFVTNTDMNVVTRRFTMGGRMYRWDMDINAGIMDIIAIEAN